MTETADVVVVGLGAVGSATLYRLAQRGARVIGIDRFDPPHDHASTHGETRITRLAIAEGDAYIPLVRRSHEIWRELEEETGETLLTQNGGLVIGTGDGAPSHGQPGFLGSTIAIARAHGIPHEILAAAEIRGRWPQFQVEEHERGYYEPSAGIVFPERAVRIQLALARRHGAVVHTNTQVLRVEPSGDGIAVITPTSRITAARVVLAAGAWLPGLVGGPLAEVARVQRQTVMWVRPTRPKLYQPETCPIFIWQHGAAEEDYLYGFPVIPGGIGVKLGSERYGAGHDPDAIPPITAAEIAELQERHVAGRLDGLDPTPVKAATCLYTCTPDAGFVLDAAEARQGVIVASACSGHGFKHAAAVGEHLAALALATAQPEPLFAAARFG